MICSLYTFPVSKQYHLELVTSRSNLDSIFPIIQPVIFFPFRHKECLRTSSTVGGLWRKQEAIWCPATLLTWTGAVIITTFGEIWCVLCFQIERKFSPLKPLVSGDNRGMEQPKMPSTYARPLGHVPLSHFFFHFSFFFYADCLTPSLISDGFFPAGNISRLRDSAPRTDYQAYLRRQNLLFFWNWT